MLNASPAPDKMWWLFLCLHIFGTIRCQETEYLAGRYPRLIPNQTTYKMNDIIRGCSIYAQRLTKHGSMYESPEEHHVPVRIQVTEYTRHGEIVLFEGEYGERVLMPDILKKYKDRSLGVYAVCMSKNLQYYKTKLSIEGLIGAKASIQDFEVVYTGLNIECTEDTEGYGQSFWLYVNGVPQLAVGSSLKIIRTKFDSTRTAISSYACCSTRMGGKRRVYNFYLPADFTQTITPAKRNYNPGDIITCHVYASTLSDVNKAREAMSGVGIRVTSVLLDNSVRVHERLRISSILLPDYPQGLKQYRIQCLLHGTQRTRETTHNVIYRHDTYLEPYQQVYQLSEKITCNNTKIYGDRSAKVILLPLPVSNRIPIASDDSGVTAVLKGKRNVVVLNNGVLERRGLFLAVCEIRHSNTLYYTTPLYLNVHENKSALLVKAHFPAGLRITRITFLVQGSMLRCLSNFPHTRPWTRLAGSSDKCPLNAVGEFLMIPKMKENCVTAYACSGFADAKKEEIISIRLMIEVIANADTQLTDKQVYRSVGDSVNCTTVGYSEVVGSTVSIPIAATLWLRHKDAQPVCLETNVIPDVLPSGDYTVECKLNPAFKTEFVPLITADKKDVHIHYEPSAGSALIPGEKIRCFARILHGFRLAYAELNGLLEVKTTFNGVPIVLADRVTQFIVPEWIDVDGEKVGISGLTLDNKCTFSLSQSIEWTCQVKACERVHYVTIEPPLGESVSVGVSIRCATQELCDHRFIYYLSLSDVTADYNEDLPPVVTNSSPIRITHEMLGNKIITCIAKGMRHKEVRVSKYVAVEGKPFGIQLVRRNNAAGTLVSDVDIVNANETLLCSSGGFPKPVISWHRVSSPKDHPDYELTIHRSSLVTTIFDPPGYYTYTCQATNELGELSLKHTFYLRNKQHIVFDQQAIVLCWVLVNLGIFACLVWMGQLIVNKELIPLLED